MTSFVLAAKISQSDQIAEPYHKTDKWVGMGLHMLWEYSRLRVFICGTKTFIPDYL